VFTDLLHRSGFFYFCVRIRCRGNVFTDPFLRNGLHNTVAYSPIELQRLYILQNILEEHNISETESVSILKRKGGNALEDGNKSTLLNLVYIQNTLDDAKYPETQQFQNEESYFEVLSETIPSLMFLNQNLMIFGT
jgi:hypothetical protein